MSEAQETPETTKPEEKSDKPDKSRKNRWWKLEQRTSAAKVVARAAYDAGVDPTQATFREDIMRVTATCIQREQTGQIADPMLRLDYARHVKFTCGKSIAQWSQFVRKQWPAPIVTTIPKHFATPLEKATFEQTRIPNVKAPTRPRKSDIQQQATAQMQTPAPPVMPPRAEPVKQTSQRTWRDGKISRFTSEKVTVVTLITDAAYQTSAIGKILSDVLSLSGVSNELLETAGSDKFADLKFKHSAHASEVSQLLRDYRIKAPWILDAFLRDIDSFGSPPLFSSDADFLLSTA